MHEIRTCTELRQEGYCDLPMPQPEACVQLPCGCLITEEAFEIHGPKPLKVRLILRCGNHYDPAGTQQQQLLLLAMAHRADELAAAEGSRE